MTGPACCYRRQSPEHLQTVDGKMNWSRCNRLFVRMNGYPVGLATDPAHDTIIGAANRLEQIRSWSRNSIELL